MPDNTLRVLIAEDEEQVTEVIERSLEFLPFSKIVIKKVKTLEEALAIINEEPPPDLVTLDLRLTDSGPENTLAHVEQIEQRCPVIVVTGKMIDGFDEMITKLNIDIIKKGTGSWLDSFIQGCVRTISRGSARQYLKMQARLLKLRDLNERLSATTQPSNGP